MSSAPSAHDHDTVMVLQACGPRPPRGNPMIIMMTHGPPVDPPPEATHES